MERIFKSLEEKVSQISGERYIFIRPYKLPLKVDGKPAEFDITYFEFGNEEKPRRYLIVSQGNLQNAHEPYVRINSECMWGRLESIQCDCAWQFAESKKIINKEKLGMIILCVDQVGKGIGLRNHSLINSEANLQDPQIPLYEKDIWYKPFIELGGKLDYRKFDDIIDILKNYNIKRVRLLTNNKDKINFLDRYGIITVRVPLEPQLNKFNRTELELKKNKGGHLLKLIPRWTKKIRNYAAIALLSIASIVSGYEISNVIQYIKEHRFDDINAEMLANLTEDRFADYIINGPQEGPKIQFDVFDQKWWKINKYLGGVRE